MTDGGYGGSGRMEISGEAAQWRDTEWPPSTCGECGKSFAIGELIDAHSPDMMWIHRECPDTRKLSQREGIFSAQRALDDHAAARKTTPETVRCAACGADITRAEFPLCADCRPEWTNVGAISDDDVR